MLDQRILAKLPVTLRSVFSIYKQKTFTPFHRADDSVAKLSFEIFSVSSGNVALDKDARLTY